MGTHIEVYIVCNGRGFSLSYEFLYPLAKVFRNDLAKLCKALWNWWPCADWIAELVCQHNNLGPERHYHDAEILRPFFDFYRGITGYYVPELTSDSSQVLKTHDDLIPIIRHIKRHSHLPRLQLTVEYFTSCGQIVRQGMPSSDQNRAVSIAARVMTTLQCSQDNKSFKQFVDFVIEKQSPLRFGPCGVAVPWPPQPANDLVFHKRNGTVAVYHYVSVLNEHLKSSRERELHGAAGLAIQEYSNLPKQLVLETLHTLNHVLFPIDSESQSILRSLVAKDAFGPELCRVNAPPQPHEELTLENPTPRGFVEAWMERKSCAQYVTMATLAGALFAILLGILSLGVSMV
ncbi:hypothetical protein F5Y09DRAFT_357749 [Xylaria sp. FL1042]|nr:hypothetical protein F5Y09DRAFT_357749 [Xylaria sp. FL1042]